MKRFLSVLAAFLFAFSVAVPSAWAGCNPIPGPTVGHRTPPLLPGPDFCNTVAGAQADSNGDNFGTACDADYASAVPLIPQDCWVTMKRDYLIFVKAFRAGVGADQDHDYNGVVNANDFTFFVNLFNLGSTSPD